MSAVHVQEHFNKPEAQHACRAAQIKMPLIQSHRSKLCNLRGSIILRLNPDARRPMWPGNKGRKVASVSV